ncbi:DUF2232 domain-containing protein [Deferrisoma sp.]
MNRSLAGPSRWAPLAGAALGSAGLFWLSLWAPGLGFGLALLSPLPLAWVARTRGPGPGLAAMGVAAAASAAVAGPAATALYVAQFAGPGVALGFFEAARRPAHQVVGAYVFLAATGTAVAVSGLAWAAGTGPLAWLDATIAQTREALARMLEGAAADPTAAAALAEGLDRTAELLRRLFPGLFGMVTALTGWVNAVSLRRVVRDPAAEPWIEWKAPAGWIWGLLAAGFSALLAGGALGTLGWNVFLVLATAYFLQGIAVVQHLFVTRGFPAFVRAIAYVLVFVQFPVMVLVAGIGAFDLWFDFRARWARTPQA